MSILEEWNTAVLLQMWSLGYHGSIPWEHGGAGSQAAPQTY